MTLITLDNVRALAEAGCAYSDTPLCTDDGQFRQLTSSVRFLLPDGRVLHLKEGLIWDENSVPWILQWLFPKSGKYAVPALAHDGLYYDTSTTQGFADGYYRALLVAVGAAPFQVRWRYWAVRRLGGGWWRKNGRTPGPRVLHNRPLITLSPPGWKNCPGN